MAFLYPDYFPFCIYEGGGYDVGAGTPYPIGMSLEEAMFFYWKVKSFNLVESWSTTRTDGASVNGATNTSLTFTSSKMSDISCPNIGIGTTGQSGTFSIVLNNGAGPFTFNDNLYFDCFIGDPKIIKDNNSYYPSFLFLREGGYYSYYIWSSWTGNFANPTFAYMASMRLGDMTGDPYQFPIYSEVTGNIYTNTYSNFTANAQRTAE